jgi:glycosyltransferase involved in cell wall biosynthesis
LKIALLTSDARESFKQYDRSEPYFGTAPQGLMDGFRDHPAAEIHVISCSRVPLPAPAMLADNIFFHQPVVGKWGWGRSLFSGCVIATRRLLNDLRPDIVHGQGTERDCAMSAVFSGFPNVLTIHGNMRVHAKRPEQRGNHYYKMAAALEWFCLKRTDGVVAISSYTRDLVAGLARKTWLLPNAADKRFFGIHHCPPPVPRILFVGSLDERKNPLGLLQACESLLRQGRCTLALAGNFHPQSPYGGKVMELVESLPGVCVLGLLDRDRLAAEFAVSSLLVLPTFEDNCPMVVLEAMAAGLPVAASRVGGVPDLVDDGIDGLLFDPHDPPTITRAIERLLADAGLRDTMGARARQKALESFHPRRIAEKHMEIYREVLDRKKF